MVILLIGALMLHLLAVSIDRGLLSLRLLALILVFISLEIHAVFLLVHVFEVIAELAFIEACVLMLGEPELRLESSEQHLGFCMR